MRRQHSEHAGGYRRHGMRPVPVVALVLLLLAAQGPLALLHLHGLDGVARTPHEIALLGPDPAPSLNDPRPQAPYHDPAHCPICQIGSHPLGVAIPASALRAGTPDAAPVPPLPGAPSLPPAPHLAAAASRAPPVLA